MLRLGLQLSLRSGGEALLRLLLTVAAVALGVTVLLGVLADFHAYQETSNRPSWESTQPSAGPGGRSDSELWNYSESIFKGRFIEQLDLAALGPQAPLPPGLTRLPTAGQYYASPAMAALLVATPADELGDRYAGAMVGTIGDAALSGPDELVIMVGYSPAALKSLPDTIQVNSIATGPELQGTTQLYRIAFGIGTITLLFPLLILINTATRLAAARREERYAAMRLVGATPRQVNVVASVDAVVGAAIGAVIGIGLFVLLQPAIASIAFSGVRFFPQWVTSTIWGYAAMVVGVPVAAAVTSLASLRRVQVSPLGVTRKVTPPDPGIWRLVPLIVGVPMFVYPIVINAKKPNGAPVFLGLVLIMVGLIMAGSWLTMQAARLLARVARGASSLLAARRLADKPKAAFRTVSGLVLAVFVGTGIASLAPALNAAQSTGVNAQLADVLKMPYASGFPTIPPKAGAALVAALGAFPGVSVVPIYESPQAVQSNLPPGGKPGPGGSQGANPGPGGSQGANPDPGGSQGANPGPVGSQGANPGPVDCFTNCSGASPVAWDSVISCRSLATLPVLGSCPPGAAAVDANTDNLLFTDNPLFVRKNLPVVTHANPAVSSDVSRLDLGALLIKTANSSDLERVRTYLTNFNATILTGGSGNPTAWQMGQLEPETFGEMAQIRNNDDDNVERVVLALLALTLLVAACSLAVTVGGSVVDRKRPFTLLRLSGTPTSALRRVVLLEAMLPLLVASLVAAAVGVGVAAPVIQTLLPSVAHAAHPGPIYYVTMAGGLAVALAVTLMTLPLIGRMTEPDSARFE